MDQVDSLLIDVRASTDGFAQDLQTMRGAMDSTLLDGFSQAGNVLERGLLGAIRRGSLGFDDLKRIALNTVNEIAAQAIQSLFPLQGGAMGGGMAGGTGGLLNFGSLLGSLFGLPGRATGGPVSPGQGYVVGERGPELFVPTSAGRVIANGTAEAGISRGTDSFAQPASIPAGPVAALPSRPRDVRVSINVVSPPGGNGPQALQRSGRQVASAVRRALSQN